MGTRSLTIMQDEHGKEIVVLYRQFDGYPEGHGADLKEFLSDMAIVNGISSRTPEKAANGMGCLAAQIVVHFKAGIGNFYLHPAGTRDAGEEYIYTVYPLQEEADEADFSGKPWATVGLKVKDTYKDGHILYDGPVESFEPK